jgi:hypothetical protein
MPTKAKAKNAIVAWKGFSKELSCNGYQFEIGKSYAHEGTVKACASGFHACTNPFDVWSYYPLGDDNRFCRVQLSGKTDTHKGDSKIAAETIFIETEVNLGEMIKAGIDHLLAEAKTDGAIQAASGGYSLLAASGDYSQLAASGYYSRLAASGYYSRLAASGHYSQLAASGHSSRLAASGYSSRLAASGDSSQLAASGHYSQLAASGHSSRLAASGYSSRLAASGDSSRLEITGEKSAAAAVGNGSTVKAKSGTPVAICEYDHNGKPIGFATGIAGADGVPADTWLVAKGGKLVAQ